MFLSKNRFKEFHEKIKDNHGLPIKNMELARRFIEKKCVRNEYQVNSLATQIGRIENYDFSNLHTITSINFDLLYAYSKYFNVSTDYLLFLSNETSKDENIKMICKYTGLSEEAIETLNKIKNNKRDSDGETHERTLFILSKLLSNIDVTNIFELIYHYLYGNYVDMGHYNEYGQLTYDGNRVFVTDKYLSQQLEIDSKYVNGALLNMITEQLAFWKSELDKNPNKKDTILPQQDDLLKNIQKELNNISELQKEKDKLKNILADKLKNKTSDMDDIIVCASNVRSFDGAIEMSNNRINEYKYTLKNLFDYDYDKEKGCDTNAKG